MDLRLGWNQVIFLGGLKRTYFSPFFFLEGWVLGGVGGFPPVLRLMGSGSNEEDDDDYDYCYG